MTLSQENKLEHIPGNYGYCGRCGQAPKEGEDCYDPKENKRCTEDKPCFQCRFGDDKECVNKQENKDWREKFDNLVAVKNYRFAMDSFYEPDGSTEHSIKEIKDFIQSLLDKQAEKQRECLTECIVVRNEVCMPIEKYQKLIKLVGEDLTNNRDE